MAQSGWGSGVCAGDVDNDGRQDLYVTYWGPNVLYRNRADSTLEDITTRAGVNGDAKQWSSGCSCIDYDRDGFDLLVTSYQAFDLATAPLPGKASNCDWKGMPVFCGPRGLPYGSVTLYHNRGDLSFEDVTATSGIGAVKGFYAFTPVAADLNGDGWTDIYIACDSTPSIFFRNNRNGTFTDIAAEAGVAFSEHGFEQGGMGVGVGDFDNDGWLDLIKTNFAGDYPNVYRNTGDGIFEDVVVRAGLGINPQYVGWGVAFADLDNDGLEDIFQVNGHVYPELNAETRTTRESYRNPRLVYRNLGNGRFEDVSAQAGAAIAQQKSSRGAAFGDFDNDGDLDVVVMNMGDTPSLLRNDLSTTNHWIQLRLEGSKSNRSAIGATVRLESGGAVQTKPVLSQSSYISQNDFRLHFGLGSSTVWTESACDGRLVAPSNSLECQPMAWYCWLREAEQRSGCLAMNDREYSNEIGWLVAAVGKVITHVVNKKALKLETIAVVVVSLSATFFAQTPEALSASAQQAAQAHRYEEAERLWRNAIDSSPRYFPALFNLGLFFFSRQQFNDAVPFLERAAEVSPQDFNSHYLRGACYQSLERGDDALRAWRIALKLNPNNARLLQIMVVEYGKGRYFQEAAEVARRALELAPNDANAYYLAIKSLQDAGQYPEALEIAGRAANRFPQSARAHFEYGFHLQKVGKAQEALQELEKAMALDPAYEEPPFFYGDLMQAQGRYEEAVLFLQRAISARTDYVPARVALAKTFMGLKKWEQAIKELNEAIRLDATHPQPHLLLSQVYFRLGDEERARSEKELSLKLRRENPTVLEAVQGRNFHAR